jgi:hypothetical protein
MWLPITKSREEDSTYKRQESKSRNQNPSTRENSKRAVGKLDAENKREKSKPKMRLIPKRDAESKENTHAYFNSNIG